MKPPQSLAGYIRQHLKEIEERLDVGVRQEVIVAELEAHGYKTTLNGFRNFLYRARRRAIEKASASNISTKEKENAATLEKSSVEKKGEVSSNPLTKKMGFEHKGTLGIDESDLI